MGYEVIMQHNKLINGTYVRKANSTIYDAATEVAALFGGKVIFTCPNFATVATADGEVMVWAK